MDTVLSRPYKVVFPFPDFSHLHQAQNETSLNLDKDGEYRVSISENLRQKAVIIQNYHKQTSMHINSLNLKDVRLVSEQEGLVCGLNNKEDYEKLLSSTAILCKAYDESTFYKRPFKLIFEYNFPDGTSSEKMSDVIRNINFSLGAHISQLEIKDVQKKILNKGFVVALNDEGDYNKILDNVKIDGIVCKQYMDVN
jgi:hypothetical protein